MTAMEMESEGDEEEETEPEDLSAVLDESYGDMGLKSLEIRGMIHI